MVHTALDGNMDQAREMEKELSELFRVEFIETNPIPIKTGASMMGFCEEVFRLPMCQFEKEENREDLKKVMENLKLI